MIVLAVMWVASLVAVWFARGRGRAVDRCVHCAHCDRGDHRVLDRGGPKELILRRATTREEAAELERICRQRDAARKKARRWRNFADRAWKRRGGR